MAMERSIETRRLLLRPLRLEDAEAVFAWVGDPEVNRYMIYPLYTDPRRVEAWIASLDGDSGEFGFVLKETGMLIGSGSVAFRSEHQAYELGYNLRRDCWGMGYATEASRAMIRWVYDTLGARDFVAAHAVKNTASGRVIRKCGFQLAHGTQYAKQDGSAVFDAYFYTMHLDEPPRFD
ncbi:MAG: GNAT family N-acetyltransferase [bacterium]|nr:GNAT family N-acetyltransferase [bacterium]